MTLLASQFGWAAPGIARPLVQETAPGFRGGRAERSIVNATVTASFLWNAGNLFLGFREVSSPELRDKDF